MDVHTYTKLKLNSIFGAHDRQYLSESQVYFPSPKIKHSTVCETILNPLLGGGGGGFVVVDWLLGINSSLGGRHTSES